MYLLTKSLVHLTPLKTIVISTKDGCPTLLANDGYFGQACTLFYFHSCLFCKFKLIKGSNRVVVVVVVVHADHLILDGTAQTLAINFLYHAKFCITGTS